MKDLESWKAAHPSADAEKKLPSEIPGQISLVGQHGLVTVTNGRIKKVSLHKEEFYSIC